MSRLDTKPADGANGADARHERLAWLLCAPAVLIMLLVTAYPILHAVGLSLYAYDLRFPERSAFVGLDNYLSVLGSSVWWLALCNTALITACSVSVELMLGMAIALLMHRMLGQGWLLRGTLRSAMLVPYAIITVVAALAWRFAFDPVVGFVNPWLGVEQAWLARQWSALLVIVLTEIWKTTPFVALLLLGGLSLIPPQLLHAARVDGASAWQRFRWITLPLLRPAIFVAVLFRCLDAFRIFDTVYIQTRGAQHTETVSIIAYDTLITRLNLGLGSAVAVLIFVTMVLIAVMLFRAFGARTMLDRLR